MFFPSSKRDRRRLSFLRENAIRQERHGWKTAPSFKYRQTDMKYYNFTDGRELGWMAAAAAARSTFYFFPRCSPIVFLTPACQAVMQLNSSHSPSFAVVAVCLSGWLLDPLSLFSFISSTRTSLSLSFFLHCNHPHGLHLISHFYLFIDLSSSNYCQPEWPSCCNELTLPTCPW